MRNFWFFSSFLLSFLFFSFPSHNSKSILLIWTICTPNDCSAIRDLPFLGYSCMRTKINKLWPQTHVAVAFLYAILCIITHTARKLKVVWGRFYLSNDCSTIGDIYSLDWSCMWDMISELWIQTRITTTFWYDILCVITLITQKLQVICGFFTYGMTALHSELSIFCVRVGCGIRMAGYASKDTSQSLR